MMSKKHVVETMVLLVIASLFLAGFYYQNQESHHQEETAQELLLKKEEEINQYISKTKNTTFNYQIISLDQRLWYSGLVGVLIAKKSSQSFSAFMINTKIKLISLWWI